MSSNLSTFIEVIVEHGTSCCRSSLPVSREIRQKSANGELMDILKRRVLTGGKTCWS